MGKNSFGGCFVDRGPVRMECVVDFDGKQYFGGMFFDREPVWMEFVSR